MAGFEVIPEAKSTSGETAEPIIGSSGTVPTSYLPMGW